MNIETVNHFMHAYKMAPWRVQRQWIGMFLLALVSLAMTAALYLDVTSRAAIAGREIQDLTAQQMLMQHRSADLLTELGTLTSTSVMEQRARDLGFRPAEPDEMEYLVVPGYSAPQPSILASLPQPGLSAPTIPPEYTQSLLDWLNEKFQALGEAQ
ncbi:MAG TPA: hypothetical protein VGJ22_09665 [Anaerolineales bacterium]|jgi:hypothetical protein